MMLSGRQARGAAIDGLLAIARREMLMLEIAIGAADDDAAAVASARLRWAIGAARSLIGFATGGAAAGAGRAAALDRIANRAQGWLVEEPARSLREIGVLVDRIAHRRGRGIVRGAALPIDARHASLLELDLDDLELGPMQLHGARITDVSARRARWLASDASSTRWLGCRLDGSSFVATVFRDSRVERCALIGARLEATSWHRAAVAHCDLRGATLVDARLERALFSDCDLRGADLRIRRAPDMASLVGARFVRCDLRGTDWSGRALGGARFVDCSRSGTGGATSTDHR